MVDVKRPGGEVVHAMAAEKVFIGRVWAAWPTYVRVSVGTKDEMAKFKVGLPEGDERLRPFRRRNLLKSRFRYSFRELSGDVCGGAIAALIALPYGLAMAALMGLPPVLGIFTSLLTAPITALLGRNPVLIGGTASATVPFIALAVRGQGIGGAAKVCIAASVFMMAFCIIRLGRHITKVPHSVVSGFSCGIGGLMIISQLRTMTGIASPVDVTSSNSMLQLWQVLSGSDQARLFPMLLAGIVILVSLLAARQFPRFPRRCWECWPPVWSTLCSRRKGSRCLAADACLRSLASCGGPPTYTRAAVGSGAGIHLFGEHSDYSRVWSSTSVDGIALFVRPMRIRNSAHMESPMSVRESSERRSASASQLAA